MRPRRSSTSCWPARGRRTSTRRAPISRPRRPRWPNAQASFARQKDLAARNVSSQQQLDDARMALDSASAKLAQTQAALTEAINGPRVQDIDAARANLRAAEATLDLARTQLARTKLIAPSDGTVMTRVIEPGTVVLPAAAVYSMAIDGEVWVRAFAPEPLLARLAPDTAVTLTTDAGKTYRGHIGYVSPAAEFTPKTVETPELRTQLVYRLRIRVENPDDGVRQGMPVTIHLGGRQSEGLAPQKPLPLRGRGREREGAEGECAAISYAASSAQLPAIDVSHRAARVTLTLCASAPRPLLRSGSGFEHRPSPWSPACATPIPDAVALDGIDARIEPGIITGLVGPDAAGKTTLLRLIAGLLRPTAGTVRVLGHDMATDAAAAHPSIGYMPQRSACTKTSPSRRTSTCSPTCTPCRATCARSASPGCCASPAWRRSPRGSRASCPAA